MYIKLKGLRTREYLSLAAIIALNTTALTCALFLVWLQSELVRLLSNKYTIALLDFPRNHCIHRDLGSPFGLAEEGQSAALQVVS